MHTLHIPKYPYSDDYLIKLKSRVHLVRIKCITCREKDTDRCSGINQSNELYAHKILNERCTYDHFVEATNTLNFRRRYTQEVNFYLEELPFPIQHKINLVDDFSA